MKVGVDLIEIARIERALERYPAFRERCFTEAERAYCDSRPRPAESYAGRFAGKEAVGKALGTGLTRGPQGLAVKTLDQATGRILVELGDDMAADHRELATAPIVVHSLRQEDFVVATTLCEQEVSDDDPA